MLPGRDGLSALARLRAKGVTTALISLTARKELGDRMEGLSLRADDSLAKPFSVEELHARRLALNRRQLSAHQNLLQVGDLELDCISRQVRCQGRIAELTAREFSLLDVLKRSAGQLFTRAQILEQVWGYEFDPGTNLVDTCVKRSRKKSERFSAWTWRLMPMRTPGRCAAPATGSGCCLELAVDVVPGAHLRAGAARCRPDPAGGSGHQLDGRLVLLARLPWCAVVRKSPSIGGAAGAGRGPARDAAQKLRLQSTAQLLS